MQHPGWILVAIGLLIAAIGVVWLIGPAVPWLGKLPGDIAVEGKTPAGIGGAVAPGGRESAMMQRFR